ncbi:MAG TPA: ATP-binding protein [Cyclobacteriaceae bacterium]|nr:ATP-binding protein [Cyclobacteriaceae bacterium]
MESNLRTSTEALKAKYAQLGVYYLIALCSIALVVILSQVLVQRFISEQSSDAHLINVSGRQRMLSQKIAKSALLLAGSSEAARRTLWLEELDSSLKEWSESHRLLQGQQTMSQTSSVLFVAIDSSYATMHGAAERFSHRLHINKHIPIDSLVTDLEIIIQSEAAFLRDMDKIVLQFEQEADSRINNLKNIELFLMLICLGVILFEILFVFLPSARSIRSTIQKLAESGEQSKAMALELGALYGSLEDAYQNLVDVDVVLDDYTVFAKCDGNGNMLYLADRFMEVMGFDHKWPENLFMWLKDQGYDEEYLQKIQELVAKGQSWNGDITAVNEEGDFVWLKLNIVPTLAESEEVESLIVVGVDETEKKEAESISREINKERVEKKVKEQQFRSALILEGQEEERKRISRDMHDGIGQLLSALKFNLEGIHSVKSNAELEKLESAKSLLKNIIKEVRRISFNLTPSALSDYGIVPVLKKFSREITKISELQVIFENQTGFLSRLDPKVENNLYRIVQEAVNNAIKYSEADEVKIILSHNAQFLHLEIKDNGKGFDLEELEEKDHFSVSGHGIFNIRERTNFINGQFDIRTDVGKGTTISIQVPLE